MRNMKQKRVSIFLLTILFVLVLSSCNSQESDPPAPTAVSDLPLAPEPTSARLTEPVYGLADVERLEILTLESFPVQINVRIQGVLPNDCAEIDDVVVQRDDDFFNMAVTIVQEPGEDCAEVEVPFDVAGNPSSEFSQCSRSAASLPLWPSPRRKPTQTCA